jgi:hypothetical protein
MIPPGEGTFPSHHRYQRFLKLFARLFRAPIPTPWRRTGQLILHILSAQLQLF